MAELVSINLSRALKLKNRVVHRLSHLDNLIANENSTLEGAQEYDTRALYKVRQLLADQLVKLKTAISTANQPVQGLIYELAECKSLVAVLGRVSTRHGPAVEGYSGARTEYVAQFRKADVDREVRRAEREIDRIQDELDAFNTRTQIAVPVALIQATETEPPGGPDR